MTEAKQPLLHSLSTKLLLAALLSVLCAAAGYLAVFGIGTLFVNRYYMSPNSVAARKRWDTRRRVDQINAVGNAVLFSIHQNYYPGTAPSGAQVLYAPTENSRILGERVQERIAGYLQPENRRAAQPAARDIYIMNHIHCPAVLVECGFLSNPQEAKTLAEEGYQIRLAMVLADSFLQFTEEIMT